MHAKRSLAGTSKALSKDLYKRDVWLHMRARLNVRVGRGSFVLAHWLHVSSVTAVSFILTRVEVASGLHLVEAQVGRVTGSRTP